MSTSPSWFDKDKFSRLVKKPVAKSGQPISGLPLRASQPLPEPQGEAATTKPLPDLSKKSSQALMTSQSVSLKGLIVPPAVITPPPAPEPIRAPVEPSHLSPTSAAAPLKDEVHQPTLPRRTSPLPALKAAFHYEIPATPSPQTTSGQPTPIRAIPPATPQDATALRALDVAPPAPMEKKEAVTSDSGQRDSLSTTLAQSVEDLTAAWEKITQLNQDLTQISQERDQAINENVLLREQMKQVDETLKNQGASTVQPEELARAIQARDEALSEGNVLREQLRGAQESVKDKEALVARLDETTHIIEERDEVRRDYIALREEFENLKQELLRPNPASAAASAEMAQQVDDLRQQVAEREQAIEALRPQLADKDREIETLRAQVTERHPPTP